MINSAVKPRCDERCWSLRSITKFSSLKAGFAPSVPPSPSPFPLPRAILLFGLEVWWKEDQLHYTHHLCPCVWVKRNRALANSTWLRNSGGGGLTHRFLHPFCLVSSFPSCCFLQAAWAKSNAFPPTSHPTLGAGSPNPKGSNRGGSLTVSLIHTQSLFLRMLANKGKELPSPVVCFEELSTLPSLSTGVCSTRFNSRAQLY